VHRLTSHTVEIKTVIRRVRGGSQAYLVQGNDGRKYIGKFKDNPQGTRTLINEWLGHWFFRKLGVTTPDITILNLSPAVATEADLHFQIGDRKIPVAPGRHFGSLCPVDPDRVAIFDFLPSTCLQRVVNPEDFAKGLVIDTLLAQTDIRQCIFVKDRSRTNANLMFRAHMIDHGGIFGGGQWALVDLSEPRRPLHPGIYSLFDFKSVCQRTIQETREITANDLMDVIQSVPCDWFCAGNRDELKKLCAKVLTRRVRLESILLPSLQMICRASGEPTLNFEPSRNRATMNKLGGVA
jgi:hypothetical protein